MWKKILYALLCLFLLPLSLAAQLPQWSPLFSVDRIIELTEELDQNLAQQQNIIEQLQKSNEELSMESQIARAELEEVLKLLKESEESLRRQIALSQNLGNLIEDQVIYQRQLERKLTFWRIITGVLATSLTTTLIIWGVSR